MPGGIGAPVISYQLFTTLIDLNYTRRSLSVVYFKRVRLISSSTCRCSFRSNLISVLLRRCYLCITQCRRDDGGYKWQSHLWTSYQLPFEFCQVTIDGVSMLFPGHNYLGPGNSLESGKPVDKDDSIAEEHDWRYHLAQNKEDVRAADRKAIKEFYNEGFNHPHAWVGAAGLGIKYGIESLTGVLYPRIPEVR